MGRGLGESIEESRARRRAGAEWLRAQRESRGLTQRELARRLDVAQDRISVYESAQAEPSKDFVRRLAKEWGMAQEDIWRGLHKQLPDDFEDDETMFRRQLEKHGREYFLKILGEDYPLPGDTDEANPGRKQRRSVVRPRKGESGSGESQERASGA